MRGNWLALAAVLLLLAPVPAGAIPLLPALAPPGLWFTDLGPGEATGAALDPSGMAYVAGTSSGRIVVWAVDATGAVAWEAPLARGIAGGLAAFPDGSGVVVVGTVAGRGSDGYVAVLNRDGGLRWERTLTTDADERLRGVAVGLDGVYVAGSFDQNLMMARVDADGTARWTRVLDTGREEVLESVLLLRDGTPVGVGWTYDGVRNRAALVHLDALGAYERGAGWIRTLPAADGGSLRAYAGGATAGGFVIAGEHSKGTHRAPYVASFTLLGALQWERTLDATGACARGLASDAAGGALLAGEGGPGSAGLLTRLGPTGDVAWGGSFGARGGVANAAASLPSGVQLVAGAEDGRAVAMGFVDAPLRVR